MQHIDSDVQINLPPSDTLHNGFRVDLSGVAAAIETCQSVKAAVALVVDAELWAFVTPEDVSEDEVIIAVQKVQPSHAVPTRFKALEEFPITNDRIDKYALLHMALNELRTIPVTVVTAAQETVDAKTEEQPGPHLQSEFYRQALYEGIASTEVVPALAAPPGVYHRGVISNSDKIDIDITKDVQHIPSFSSSSSSSTSESEEGSITKAEPVWLGYEDDVLPEKTQGRLVRNLRHQIFSLYRRLFGVIFIVNMAVLISLFMKGRTTAQELGLIVVANLFCSILMRQDYVINAFFTVFCAVPSSGLVWLCAFAGQATREVIQHGPTSVPTLAVTYVILLLLVGIVVFAYPKARTTHHDSFEKTHRFLGWSATALVWCQVILLVNDYRLTGQTLGHALIHAPPFWMVVILTCSIMLPWLRLRKVPVRAEVLSNHAVRFYFDYVTTQPGQFTRVSDSPLLEWHSFAAIAEPGKKGYSAVVSRAGDWTSRQIAEPPTHIWVRGVPVYGVLRVATLFRRVLLVGTGSGIGPLTPVILAGRVPIRLLWTAPNVRQTFGDKLVDSILDASPGAVIYDTRVHGKPDMVKLTYRVAREFNAEAIVIISNEKLTQKVVYGMMSRGIPTFGAIWDS
ncbi:hypothetical protein EUX98_g3625 [Antrodiella citrinella]|uniref:AMP-dependent synthetase/ligase domain-containing protein n=1 Tax=Antrodiella citrinella TaxID=2447956 RepID=A0A4S4MW38_9APHY|nr:hypothetical protein EUX98_g3625 [Antrodiella citrinella]